jgi:hypothetical protein
MTCLLLLSDVPRLNVVLLALFVAGFGALIEADSWRGFDNFFLPLGLYLILAGQMQATPLSLILLAVTLLVVITGFLWAARPLGLTVHAARVYASAVFLLLTLPGMQNIVLPLLVLLLHPMVRRHRPSAAKFPELDLVASLALVSFGWLALGRAVGPTAVLFYGVTAAGMAMGLIAVATGRAHWALTLAAGVAISAIIWGVGRLNPPAAHWAGEVWPLGLAVLVLCAAVPLKRPDWFHTSRMAKIACMALALPLPAYLILAFGVGQ